MADKWGDIAMNARNIKLEIWEEDLRNLQKRVAHTDLHFELISSYLIRIMNEANMHYGMTFAKKRCIEKMRIYRTELIRLMAETKTLWLLLKKELPENLFNLEKLVIAIPPEPLDWYWQGSVYDGIQRMTTLLDKLGNMSEYLKKTLNEMLLACCKQ